jgi:hypothetical protein
MATHHTPYHRSWPLLAGLVCAAVPALAFASEQVGTASPTRVVTYHYDNLRTGWNFSEEVLTPSAVRSGRFKLLKSSRLTIWCTRSRCI